RSLVEDKNIANALSFYIYDNSAKPQVISLESENDIYYEHDCNNSGISRAYNQGAKYAKENNKKWILVLDQDTVLPIDWYIAYYQAVRDNYQLKLFAPILLIRNNVIFSPCKYKMKRGFHLDEITSGRHSLYKVSPVNSGMLISVKEFFAVGGYNEKVKLDFSDFQFIERFRKKNEFFYVVNLICNQDFSNDNPSVESQVFRFIYYVEGAYYFEKDGLKDKLQFLIVVFLRM